MLGVSAWWQRMCGFFSVAHICPATMEGRSLRAGVWTFLASVSAKNWVVRNAVIIGRR